MLTSERLIAEEECLRKLVQALPDDKRLAFYQQAERRLKDPDTYAALNYLFIAGLHHFYLGKRLRGLLNFVVFMAGVGMLFTPLVLIGIVLTVAVIVCELFALFNAQAIVQAHNNRIMAQIYQEIARK